MQDEANGNEKILTAQEVSCLLKIPLSTVYELTKKQVLHGTKVGKHWRYLESEIRGYLLGLYHPVRPNPASGTPEKRSHPRVNCELTAKLQTTLSRKLEPELYGFVHNLSVGGALFVDTGSESGIAAGDPVVVGFEMPGTEKRWFEIHGRVLRRDKGFAVKFKAVMPEVREAIEHYVG